MTTILARAARRGTAALLLSTVGACAGAGNVGEILGSVLGGAAGGGGGGGSNQVSGVVRGVDTRAQQIGLQLSNGQTVGLVYDNQTKVVFNNQSYAVTSLDPGDQITARIQQSGQQYYTDLVQVDQPVQNTSGGSSSSASGVQAFQGTVRQVDQANGMFSMNTGNGTTVIVSLPYNVSRADQNRFQSLRAGDAVRLQGVFLNNQRVELRQFY